MIDHIQLISVGDMIEAINGQSLLGCRHYEVARLLKELPRGRTFTLKLTEPRKAFGEELPPAAWMVPFTWALVAVPRATSRWCSSPAGHSGKGVGAAPPCPGEGLLALRPAWEEDGGEEEAAHTPSFQEPLAQPSAPNPGQFPTPQEARLGCPVPVPPLLCLASLTLRNGPKAPGVVVGDSDTLPQADRAGLWPSSYTPLALGKAAGDPGPTPFLSLRPWEEKWPPPVSPPAFSIPSPWLHLLYLCQA